jgi:diguanylate cyclase (GGDEF)-like protein
MKVLIVEDSVAMAAFLASRVTEYGYTATVAANGLLGLEQFREEAPDLVLMDLEMPVMDGLEATRQIREWESTQAWAWTPIIFLTASGSEGIVARAVEAGADDFIAKAAPEDILFAKMRAMARIAKLRRGLHAAHKQLEALAERDGLTDLANRRALDRRSDAAWAKAVEAQGSFALLMLDMDNFKRYNDAYGHAAGDKCLQALAEVLRDVALDCDRSGVTDGAFAARYGGEEFVLVMPGASWATYESAAELVLTALRDRAIAHAGNSEWGIATVSIGGCHVELANGGIVNLFRAADLRLYDAKAKGRNRAHLDTRLPSAGYLISEGERVV